METNGQFHTPASLHTEIRQEAGWVPKLDWMLKREKSPSYARKIIHSLVTGPVVY
jgi:hypothetical protein